MTERARQRGAAALRATGLAACLLAGVAGLATPHAVAGDVFVDVRGQDVSLVASDTPIRDVIDALAAADVLFIEAGTAPERRITVRFRGLPIDAIVRRLLRGESFELVARDSRPPALRLPGGTAVPSGPAHPMPAEMLLSALSSADAEERLEAVLAIGDTGEAEFVRYVAPYRYDPAPGVRIAAAAVVEALGAAAEMRFDLRR